MSKLRPGDLVQALHADGIASHVVVRADAVSEVLADHRPEHAVLYPAFCTAWLALSHAARVEHGESVLVHGVSAPLGLACVQVARLVGAHVFITTDNEGVRDFLRFADVAETYSCATQDFADTLRARRGGAGVDVVVNLLTGPARSKALDLVQPGGRFVDLGAPEDGAVARLDQRVYEDHITVHRPNLPRFAAEHPDKYAIVFREVASALQSGKLRLSPVEVTPASDASDVTAGDASFSSLTTKVLDLSRCDFPVRRTGSTLFRPDRTYLVSGGLAGFGLATAEWLAEHGARAIVLGSRRGEPDAEAREAIGRMQQWRAKVHCLRLDVTCPESVDSVLGYVREHLPPLAGVFHSAMVLEDQSIGNLETDSLRRVMLPKAHGAWLLHEKTAECPLDHFVLFSSAAALVGNPSQAAYAAANAYLDGLASLRRSQGLAATSVAWGAIANVGVVARNATTEAYLSTIGLRAMSASKALSVLQHVLGGDSPAVGILDVDWPRWMASFPRTPWNRLAYLSGGDRVGKDSPVARLREELAKLGHDARKRSVLQLAMTAAAGVLRVAPDRLDSAAPLRGYGLDSLMALELGSAIEQVVGIRIPAIELLAGTTLDALADRLLERLDGASSRVSRRPMSEAPQLDLRAHFLSRICVQPPYFALHDMVQQGDWVEATVLPLAPSEFELDSVSCAEAARHLAIVGSCAASLQSPTPGKVYYPVLRAHYPESRESGDLPATAYSGARLERARVRARCTEFDVGASRATAVTELLDQDGKVVVSLVIAYHVIPEPQFRRLFANRFQVTHETTAADPYLSWRPLPRADEIADVITVNLGRVDPLSCLGHFVGYPALPVSIMMRDAIRLIAEGVRRRHGWARGGIAILGGNATTESFLFAHEPVDMTTRFVRNGRSDGDEIWRCTVHSRDRLAATFELEVRGRPLG